ncbi:hypothetical protein [Labilibaculum antarcticum]|uniref:RiboL-PSP-HEPN domain-containing protein n=1 Tax=Labilibaculum antarcticum TaxID=1717717 RepID=A0A1Y1CN14_9BACT|nr:hypothetical protein [Labilibaculum antarcticum]BAX81664.1 hypothetical protein ALGA_3366 [Labilibaculum antarcticum]
MIEDIYFLDDGQVKITAASVGISKLRWTSVKELEISTEKHIDIMSNNRFDHLPIESLNGSITEFFKTEEPNNYKNIIRHKIKYNDLIPLDTNIKDVIEKFANDNRTFYFLCYHKNISGLITLGNLNCKQVQVYIFSLICELERELGDFINSCLSNQEINDWLISKVDKDYPGSKYALILKNFNDLTKLDLENQLTEHFFLVDFFKIIKDKELYEKLAFSKKEWQDLSSINELRKRIAHPTRSLLDKDNDIFKLLERLNKIEDLTYRIVTERKNSSR